MENPVFTVFYQKLSATIIYINKIIACEVKMKQTNLAATLQFQCLQEKRFKNWFDKVVDTIEHVK